MGPGEARSTMRSWTSAGHSVLASGVGAGHSITGVLVTIPTRIKSPSKVASQTCISAACS